MVKEETPEPIATTLQKDIRVLEAQIGRIYWDTYFDALDRDEPFEYPQGRKADKRTRQPAQDPLNALINYGYGMLYGEVEGAVLTAGLDPHIGVLHREEFNKPAFVFDAIEQFRPWVDKLIAELAIAGEMKSDWFEVEEKGVWLTTAGKKTFIPAWYEMILKATPFNGKRIKRKDQVLFMLRELAQSFLPDNKDDSHD